MQVLVNGQTHEVKADATVRELLVSLGLGEALVAVERNEEIIPRANHATTALAEGDELEVVHFVGGG